MGAAALSVHPRLRGELVRTLAERKRAGGSSPLTRGTRLKITNLILKFRFIPAYAGNSVECTVIGNKETVHPRLRGELKGRGFVANDVGGSSPLTRGTPIIKRNHGIPYRFIPAYAGNSSKRTRAHRKQSVHPRLRGELGFSLSLLPSLIGSSPLTRGTPIDDEPAKGKCLMP